MITIIVPALNERFGRSLCDLEQALEWVDSDARIGYRAIAIGQPIREAFVELALAAGRLVTLVFGADSDIRIPFRFVRRSLSAETDEGKTQISADR